MHPNVQRSALEFQHEFRHGHAACHRPDGFRTPEDPRCAAAVLDRERRRRGTTGDVLPGRRNGLVLEPRERQGAVLELVGPPDGVGPDLPAQGVRGPPHVCIIHVIRRPVGFLVRQDRDCRTSGQRRGGRPRRQAVNGEDTRGARAAGRSESRHRSFAPAAPRCACHPHLSSPLAICRSPLYTIRRQPAGCGFQQSQAITLPRRAGCYGSA